MLTGPFIGRRRRRCLPARLGALRAAAAARPLQTRRPTPLAVGFAALWASRALASAASARSRTGLASLRRAWEPGARSCRRRALRSDRWRSASLQPRRRRPSSSSSSSSNSRGNSKQASRQAGRLAGRQVGIQQIASETTAANSRAGAGSASRRHPQFLQPTRRRTLVEGASHPPDRRHPSPTDRTARRRFAPSQPLPSHAPPRTSRSASAAAAAAWPSRRAAAAAAVAAAEVSPSTPCRRSTRRRCRSPRRAASAQRPRSSAARRLRAPRSPT
mmetsp:Transcript_16585/g.49502  ORF Transcript_16585/g.49502 Transcript_16585/m.49502 type:complete len:274 (-) Transcript_16585:539-1360(-)